MGKPAQLAKLIELRIDLRRESQDRGDRHDLGHDAFPFCLALMVGSHMSEGSFDLATADQHVEEFVSCELD